MGVAPANPPNYSGPMDDGPGSGPAFFDTRYAIPNYGERYRHGQRISTGFVESAVNQVVSKRMANKQQMQWTQRGAHLLLQVRTRVLRRRMGAGVPGLVSRIPAAAAGRCALTPGISCSPFSYLCWTISF
jgi:hypothetical protein